MTVIAIQIKASPSKASNPRSVPSPGPPSWVDALANRVGQNVVGTHAEALPDQASAMSTVGGTNDVDTIPEHVRGIRRFVSSEDKAAVLDTIERDVVADAEWYRIESHECDHDEPADSRSGCPDWATERENGTVPSGV